MVRARRWGITAESPELAPLSSVYTPPNGGGGLTRVAPGSGPGSSPAPDGEELLPQGCTKSSKKGSAIGAGRSSGWDPTAASWSPLPVKGGSLFIWSRARGRPFATTCWQSSRSFSSIGAQAMTPRTSPPGQARCCRGACARTWSRSLGSRRRPGFLVHWHDHNVHAYLVEGTTDFLDAETGIRYNVGPWMHDVAIPEVLRTRMYARICRGRLVPRSAT